MSIPNYTRDGDPTHYFTENPVVPPEGFSSPCYQIGERVKVVFTVLNPSHGRYNGITGTVSNVVFCRSDGRTTLYGVRFDVRAGDGALGARFESFELDKV